MKWLAMSNTQEQIRKLMNDAKSNPTNIINQGVTPFISSPKLTVNTNLQNSSVMSATMRSNPQTPPRSPCKKRKGSDLNSSLDSSPGQSPRNLDLTISRAGTGSLSKSMVSSKIREKITDSSISIPQFYYPNGNPVEQVINDDMISEINSIFAKGTKDELSLGDFEDVTMKIMGLPRFMNRLLFSRIEKDKKGKIGKNDFLKVFKAEYLTKDPWLNCFNLIKKPNTDYIEASDFRPIMNILLDIHPGLEFLKNTPEFQERYSDTVIQRILYAVDTNDDGKITRRKFKKSDLFEVLEQVDREEDINKVRRYFSYEHFYVLYCKFWELDADHDFFINKEDFSRYSGHALSRKAVDRIFAEVPRRFKSKIPGKMSYDDFIWFMISEEDKSSERSIDYWFKVIDLDQNDIITGYEIEYFYEEQKQRLEHLNHEPVFYEDVLCQMADIFKPEKDVIYRRENFKAQRSMAGIFFNCLTNLNKFVAYEGRDPFAIKNEMQEFAEYSEWDRFAQGEYVRLAFEEENAENSNMFDAADIWDGDEEGRNK